MNDKERETRYGHRSRTGANEPKRHERKEQREDWRPRQGGDQTRTGDPPRDQDRDQATET